MKNKNLSDNNSNFKLSEKVKSEIKMCFENTVLCARSHSPKEAYDYAEKMANYIIRKISKL